MATVDTSCQSSLPTPCVARADSHAGPSCGVPPPPGLGAVTPCVARANFFAGPSCAVPPPPGLGAVTPCVAPANPHAGPSCGVLPPPRLGAECMFESLLARNGFVTKKIIGRGLDGIVFQALSLINNIDVAIKIVSKRVCKLFEGHPVEALALYKVRGHPNIIRLFELKDTGDFFVIVMELAEGGTIDQLVCDNFGLSEDTSKIFFRDLIRGLQHCHGLGVVHRDIKCGNLLIDRNGKLKISDFGFAACTQRDKPLKVQCGTHAYAAPEILASKPYDGRAADIWSAGVVLYHMIYDRLPFDDLDPVFLSGEIPIAPNIMSGPSDNCRDLIMRILQYDPLDRLSLEDILGHPWMKE